MNDNVPEIQILSLDLVGPLQIKENIPPPSHMGYVYVYDADSGKNGLTNCRSNSDGFLLVEDVLNINLNRNLNKIFGKVEKITNYQSVTNRKSYKILAVKSFDRETMPYSILSIECDDSGKFGVS